MKKLWLKIQAFFVTLFGSEKKLEKFIHDHVDEAVAIFTEIRNVVKSPVINVIELVLPAKFTGIIESARKKIEDILDIVIVKTVGVAACASLPTFQQRFECYIAFVKTLSPMLQGKAMLGGASTYLRETAPIALKESVADTVVQQRVLAEKIALGAATVTPENNIPSSAPTTNK